MSPFFLSCLPGYYYYKTRYAFTHQGVLHVLKYWGVHLFLLVLLAGDLSLEQGLLLFSGWLSFQSAYDLFCRENDQRANMEGQGAELRTCPGVMNWPQFRQIKLIMAVGSAGLGFAWAESQDALNVSLLIIGMSVVFFIHNRLPAPVRGVSLYALYLSKSLLFYVVFQSVLSDAACHRYGLFAFLFNASYLPQFLYRKIARVSRVQLDEWSWQKRSFLMPLLFKCLVLAGLMVVDSAFMMVLMLTVLLTAVEFLLTQAMSRQA
jgi:hypothetical protein